MWKPDEICGIQADPSPEFPGTNVPCACGLTPSMPTATAAATCQTQRIPGSCWGAWQDGRGTALERLYGDWAEHGGETMGKKLKWNEMLQVVTAKLLDFT